MTFSVGAPVRCTREEFFSGFLTWGQQQGEMKKSHATAGQCRRSKLQQFSRVTSQACRHGAISLMLPHVWQTGARWPLCRLRNTIMTAHWAAACLCQSVCASIRQYRLYEHRQSAHTHTCGWCRAAKASRTEGVMSPLMVHTSDNRGLCL